MVTQADKAETPDTRVTVGRITGVYGVKGWLRIYSFTEPRANILEYNPWQLRLADGWHSVELLDGKAHGKGVIAHLAGCEDRDQAARWVDVEIAVRREQLPAAEAGEFYWRDLIGLRVITTAGQELGVVDHLLETGANDVLVVQGERERLIPYAMGEVVTAVDLEAGELQVDWDPEY